ncbi:hypothetical protein ABPG72_021967 [Tetrahymena utriculariae]
MDPKKKKTLNIPENKGLIHNFKFDIEIPFAPNAFSKTLYYQLDQERHTRPKVLNADVKGMCNLFVNCDLGLPIDDLNMKPHIYNLQEGNDNHHHLGDNGNTKGNSNQLHPDDLALINEDIIVSDTEEDEETLKTQKEQKLLDQRVKEEQQRFLMKQKMMQKQSELAKDKDTDFSQGFEQVKLAIEHSFITSNNIKLEEIKHPTDPNRSVKRVFNILPNLANQSLKLGVISHKQKVESLTNSFSKGRFCTLFNDISFQDKNQKIFRLFVQKLQDEEPYKPKTLFDEDMIEVESQYNELFQEDEEVVVEKADEELLNHNQIKLKNKSVFNYSDHSTKLQANDILLLFSKQAQNEQIQNAYFQKVEFQISLDQERKELAIANNVRSQIELDRYVKMDIIDEEQIKWMKEIDQEIVDEEFGNPKETKNKSNKQKSHRQHDNDDDDEEENDGDFDMEEELEDEDEELQDIDDDDVNRKNSTNKSIPTKSYNLRESRKQNNVFNQLSAEKKSSNIVAAVAAQEEDHEAEEQIDDIFSDGGKDNNNANIGSAQNVNQIQTNKLIEEDEEDDEQFQFGANRKKVESEDKDNQWADSKQKKSKNKDEDDDFINDEEEEEEEEEIEDVSSVSDHKDQEIGDDLQKYFQKKSQQQQQSQQPQVNIGQVEEMSDDDDDEFPL